MTRAAAWAVAAALLVGACGGGDGGAAIKLDGSPRIPDDEGVATNVTVNEVVLDGGRRYKVSDELVSFSTFDRKIRPLLGFENQYVQIGVHKGTVMWLSGVGVAVPGEPPSAYYTGTLERVDDKGRAVFKDGTVLRLADGLAAPAPGRAVQVRIDAKAKRIAAFQGA